MARIKWRRCRGWCQTTDDELISSLEYQVSFYSAVTAGLFLSLQSFVFFIINTNLFGKPFVVLCFVYFYVTGVYASLG